MTWLVAITGMLIGSFGVFALIAPASFRAVVRRLTGGPGGLRAILIMRGTLALIFWFAAADTRLPGACRALAVIFLLSAAIIPVLGEQRIHAFTERFLMMPAVVVTFWSIACITVGGFIVWLSAVPGT